MIKYKISYDFLQEYAHCDNAQHRKDAESYKVSLDLFQHAVGKDVLYYQEVVLVIVEFLYLVCQQLP